ncbi:PAS domain S-box-containing protein [Oceanisphaera litoralis]|uniref:LuxQ periplasmic sensor domain-containing protein n=1 Tax=Oceanisphaera litoralis TaxID=225144 RepID=UPI001EF8FBDE|nr:LuxQ periplasmic sensor domain-containing protein [Oceanisphaera litoralis]MBM7457236.1 PAS domain S-box-containing protein [Oceanisphaera litoralis]
MLVLLLPAFLLLAVAVLTLTYNSTSKMVDESIRHQLQETNNRVQGRLDSYLSGLDHLLSATAEHPELAAILLRDDREAARDVLQKTLNNSHGEYLDLLILTRQEQYWANMNSPLYLLEHRLASLIADTPFYNKWAGIELDPSPAPLTAWIQRYPILSPDSGQVIGSLFGGLVLNDNLTLLSLLGQGIKNINIQLILRGKPVGPAFINSDIPSEIFTQALSSLRPYDQKHNQKHDQKHGYYFSLQPLLINGEQSELQLLLLTDDTMFRQLQQTYGHHSLLVLILVLITALALSLYTLKLISSPLNNLTRFAEQVSHGQAASFQPGRIEEFNLLGTSLEQAEKSLRLNRLVLENMTEAVVIFDRARHLIYINQAYTQITGQSRDEIAGQLPSSVLHRVFGDKTWRLSWHMAKVTGSWQGEIPGHSKNSPHSLIRLSITTLREMNDEISHYVVVFSDISIFKGIQQPLPDASNAEAEDRQGPRASQRTSTRTGRNP